MYLPDKHVVRQPGFTGPVFIGYWCGPSLAKRGSHRSEQIRRYRTRRHSLFPSLPFPFVSLSFSHSKNPWIRNFHWSTPCSCCFDDRTCCTLLTNSCGSNRTGQQTVLRGIVGIVLGRKERRGLRYDGRIFDYLEMTSV